jgi:hypothetical protein
MCYVEDVFHIKCKHWGRQRFSGEPCVRSRVVNGVYTGCSEMIVAGMANSDQPCWLCKRPGEPRKTLASSSTSSSPPQIPQQQRKDSGAHMSCNASSTSLQPPSQTSSQLEIAWTKSPRSRPISVQDFHRLSSYGKLGNDKYK